jgi:DNA modification methylase
VTGALVQPYYHDDVCTIYHGDAREVLPTLPRDFVDLLITDPPYGVEWQSGFRGTKLASLEGDDGSLDVAAVLALAMPALREARHLYVFGPADLSSLPLGATTELIWDKGIVGMGNLTLPWGPAHERITFGVHVARPSNRARGNGRLAARLRRGSVIGVQRKQSGELEDWNVQHPTEKPVDLLRQLIESSSVIGETVLDPFMGCGSTLVAAKREDRRGIGIELNERYCETAAKRLSQPIQAQWEVGA